MSRVLIPAAANLIITHGSHVLLMKRSEKTAVWPNFWAFPWGKVDENEFFREAALREAKEEIGIHANPLDIIGETILMHRSVQGTKVVYFGHIEHYENAPEILEKNLATDLAWFPVTDLPKPMIPHHKTGLNAILKKIAYTEVDLLL
jgi:8-oxo-dGTP diphosphatase